VAPWDWAAIPVPLAERYLGPRDVESEVYARHDLDELPPSVLILPEFNQAAVASFLASRASTTA